MSATAAPLGKNPIRDLRCLKTSGPSGHLESGGSVKLMLNAEERQQLMDLGYSEEEAENRRVVDVQTARRESEVERVFFGLR